MGIDLQFRALTAFLMLSLGACGAQPAAERGLPAIVMTKSEAASRGLAFAAAHCSRCHAVATNQLSLNPAAPSFEAVVTTPGLTSETLAAWLRTSHNFPDMMNFTIDADRIDDLTAYMMTLRDGDRP